MTEPGCPSSASRGGRSSLRFSAGRPGHEAYLAFGEYGVVFIMEAPDNVTAAALSLAFSAGGSMKAIKTTPLMTIDEGIEAMRKGAEVAATYRPPAG